LLPIVLAESARFRHDYLTAVTARAEYAERSREEEARHRVADERVRIARELHDVVAHHLALANAQASTAAYLARDHPDQIQRILTELTGTTSAALRELKATVGLLRQPDATNSPLEPTPGLDQLPELTAAFACAGLGVEVIVEGEEQQLSPGAELTAFRIVQEALTNVTKHATTNTASVRLAYSGDRLTITVTNDAGPTTPASPNPGQGFGLVGMRERVQSAGGQFQATPQPEGGFTVATELPIRR
jgi:signal transduction histidine kinase